MSDSNDSESQEKEIPSYVQDCPLNLYTCLVQADKFDKLCTEYVFHQIMAKIEEDYMFDTIYVETRDFDFEGIRGKKWCRVSDEIFHNAMQFVRTLGWVIDLDYNEDLDDTSAYFTVAYPEREICQAFRQEISDIRVAPSEPS